jgi:hypothetical protein
MDESTIRVPISDVQADLLFQHALSKNENEPIRMSDTERSWIVSQVRKVSLAKIVAADLDIANGEWVVTLQV